MADTNRAEKFDRDFRQFQEDHHNWQDYLTDSMYYELMWWYDATYNPGDDESYSAEAHDFATYVLDKIHEENPRLEMNVLEGRYNGSLYYGLAFMNHDELLSLLKMIKSACLAERRMFNGVKEQIEKILEL